MREVREVTELAGDNAGVSKSPRLASNKDASVSKRDRLSVRKLMRKRQKNKTLVNYKKY